MSLNLFRSTMLSSSKSAPLGAFGGYAITSSKCGKYAVLKLCTVFIPPDTKEVVTWMKVN